MKKLLNLVIGISFLTLLLHAVVPVSAQEEIMHSAATETISLQVGDIFEILPVHDIPEPAYTWILTQDRSFLEASRAPSFRKRLIQPGTYTLYAEIASPDGSRRVSRTITLDYIARQPGTPVNGTGGEGEALVHTEPAASTDGKIAMTGGRQLVRLTPISPDITPLSLDLDLNRDADGDGNNTNDIQSSETFFHTDATPMYLWITDDPLTTHSISVTAALPDGARTQKLDILHEDIARAQGAVQSPVRIETEQTGERTYTFNAVFDNPDSAAGQLLYQWQFGDGQQSLITKSEHTYAEDGTFTVSLLVRNLRDGKEVASTSTSLTVSAAAASSAASEQASSEPDETPSTGGGLNLGGFGRILMLAGLFLGSVGLGVLIIFLMGRLRKGKTTLAEKLENIEQTMVKPVSQEPAPLTIAPPIAAQPVKTEVVEPKRVEPPAAIAQREQEQAVARPAPQPAPKAENTPAWLNTAAAPKQATPTPQKPTPTPAPVQTPKPAPVPKPAPAAPAPSQTPAWLQQSAAPKVTPTPAPTQQPAPVQPARPADRSPARAGTDGDGQPKPATPAPSQTPAWLQQPAAPKVSPAPTSAPTPQPKPATPAPAPVQTPKPVTPPATPTFAPVAPVQAPKPTPAPAPVPAPVQPAAPEPVAQPKPMEIPASPAPEPTVMDIPAADQPIAIIKAESLNPQNGENQ